MIIWNAYNIFVSGLNKYAKVAEERNGAGILLDEEGVGAAPEDAFVFVDPGGSAGQGAKLRDQQAGGGG